MAIRINVKCSEVLPGGATKNIGNFTPVTLSTTGAGVSHQKYKVPTTPGVVVWDSALTNQCKTGLLGLVLINQSTTTSCTVTYTAASSAGIKTEILFPGIPLVVLDVQYTANITCYSAVGTVPIEVVLITY